MRRREFIAVLGGAAAWPLAAKAQQPERMRRIGILLNASANDPQFQAWVGAFLQGLALLGWAIGSNVRIKLRWAEGNAAEVRRHAAELVVLQPDVILAHGASTVTPLLQATRSVPIVFPVADDPVGAGLVDSLARPGGNATGFMTFEYSMGGKWLELLKQIAPSVTRVAVLRDATQGGGNSEFAVIQAMAPLLRVEVNPVNVRDAGEIERATAAFARFSNGGLIVTAGPTTAIHRELIIALAARHKLPTIYFQRIFVAAGGLISYGSDFVDQYRRAAGYVDRILKGEKPADLPVQAPTKYELVINLKTAKALGLTVPLPLLGLADEARVTRRTVPIMFSMMLVQASERRSSAGRKYRYSLVFRGQSLLTNPDQYIPVQAPIFHQTKCRAICQRIGGKEFHARPPEIAMSKKLICRRFAMIADWLASAS
jgi:putative tryptophan/tyrosine transport system substrate-binding protein